MVPNKISDHTLRNDAGNDGFVHPFLVVSRFQI